jgi:hypothetical protein
MTSGSWPYLPAQCPSCMYLKAFVPAFRDDTGYEIRGFCRHPRIAMELFVPQQRRLEQGPCALFVGRSRTIDG